MVAFRHVHFDDAVGTAVERRALRVDAESAADRITPKQEPLGTAQHFRTLEIEQARHDGAVAAFVEVVLEECRGRVAADAKVLSADAAHGDAVDKGVCTVARYARSEGDEILDVVKIDIPDKVASHGRDGERHVLDVLGSLRRRYDDFLDFLRSDAARCRGKQGSRDGLRDERLAESN